MREDSFTEFKREYTEDIRREIIAFANAQGGKIYVGIEDDGTVCGVADPDDVMLRIAGSCRDAIHPDVTMFVRYEVEERDGRTVVAVEVAPGTAKPYFLASKGLRPAGVYVRQGAACAPASEAAIRQMIRDTDGDSWEMMRSLEQGLTFEEAGRTFAAQQLEFGPAQMRTLGLQNADGIYTNLGLLLSDQCPHIIKAAYFRSRTQDEFQDRKEFTGSLFRQIREAYEYLDLLNKTKATFSGLYRTDVRDYPENALREALLNAVVHRDYGRSAPTLISIYSDRTEMVSIGGLPQDVEIDDIMMGLSVCRNPRLAEVFYRLKLIEAYGTGMRKIFGAYSTARPEVQTSPHAFKIILPNRNAAIENVRGAEASAVHEQIRYGTAVKNDQSGKAPASGSKAETVRTVEGAASGLALKDYESAVYDLLRTQETFTRQDLEVSLQVSLSTANRVLRSMLDAGKIVRVGHGKNTKYMGTGQESDR